MKIILIGPTESILTKRGNRFPNIADFLHRRGYAVTYLTSNFYHAEKRFFSRKEIDEAKCNVNYKLSVFRVLGYYSNVSVRRVFSNYFFSLFVFIHLLFRVNKGHKVLIPSRPIELIYFISLLKRFRKCDIYLDIQDIWPDALQIESTIKQRIFTAYCNVYLNPSLKYYNRAMHVAPSFEKWLKRYTGNRVESKFIPLGWEKDRWGRFKKSGSFSVINIKLVCVAQLQKQIDVIPILQVLTKKSNLHLTIIGEDGNGERYREVTNYIEDNSIGNVKIVGKVERKELTTMLQTMDIGILPMISSSIPNKIFDYLAAELPIIVLGDNDSSDFVAKNGIGWSCEFTSNALLELLEGINYDDYDEKFQKVMKVRVDYSRDKLHEDILKLLAL